MDKSYKQTIQEIEEKINELSTQGISIQSLNESLRQLKTHTENVEKIEENIDAIREEVIEKIKDELQYNKKAGSFSIYGFWVGSIALIVSIGSIIYNEYNHANNTDFTKPVEKIKVIETSKVPDSLLKKIDVINYKIDELVFNSIGFSDMHATSKSELLLYDTYDPTKSLKVILKDSIYPIKIGVQNIEETIHNEKLTPSATLIFYVGDKKMGRQGIKEIFRQNKLKYYYWNEYYNGATIYEGDTIKIFRDTFLVEKIYLKNSKTKRVGSDKNAVLIKRIKRGDYLQYKLFYEQRLREIMKE
ncbi:hypothetical protein [Aquimarina agarilytica]|uniref:hypothetical protein n=1 Tax=Aquimarina agarilytica TaxID=1087449 RepID=UPI0002893823|nr:hypothetical protein [Aquimarina agarilytica]